jgi:uroporphyrinogen-III decarboxylase
MEVTKMEKQLSPEEKQEALFEQWLSAEGVEFVNPEAEKSYKERVTRIKDAIQLKKKPDRVPVLLIPSFFPAFYAGMTPREVMYDAEKANMAWKKFYLDFQPDSHHGCIVPGPGRFFDILDYKLYKWPGHGVTPESTYQCIEGEYMKADEYDDFLQDPTYYFTTTYLPRIFGVLEPFKQLPNLTTYAEMYGTGTLFFQYGLPDVQDAFKALLEAGSEALKWMGYFGAFMKEMAEAGIPAHSPGFTKAPFDILADTLRGTKGIMLDMYRQPDKLIEAMDTMLPFWIQKGVIEATRNGMPLIFIPLHKGADGFMSDEQYKTFYWPYLKKIILGLIDEGIVPFVWAEGGYNTRLEVIRDIPKGKVVWLFDQVDIAKAKEALDGIACIAGTMPMDLLTLGTPEQIKAHVKKCIDVAGNDGGYMMANGAFFDDVPPENIKAMVDFTKEYGIYK